LVWVRNSVFLLLVVLCSGFGWVTYDQARTLVYHPKFERKPATIMPELVDLQVQEVVITNAQGMRLFGYFAKSNNGAYVLLQHGYKASRSDLLEEAKVLQDAGFGVLISSVRAHDKNDGDQISFGVQEMQDLQSWYDFLLGQGAQAGKIGILGNSMGASMAIEYASRNPDVAAVVSVSSFSSLQDTISVSVQYFTGLPSFPFAPAIVWWAEWILGMDVAQVNATKAAAKLCQTPILVMQGGADVVVSVSSGKGIYDAACGDKEFWFEDDVGHVKFDRQRPIEFAQRVTGFFRQHLL